LSGASTPAEVPVQKGVESKHAGDQQGRGGGEGERWEGGNLRGMRDEKDGREGEGWDGEGWEGEGWEGRVGGEGRGWREDE